MTPASIYAAIYFAGFASACVLVLWRDIRQAHANDIHAQPCFLEGGDA